MYSYLKMKQKLLSSAPHSSVFKVFLRARIVELPVCTFVDSALMCCSLTADSSICGGTKESLSS